MLTRKTLARSNERPKEINRLPLMLNRAVSFALGSAALYILASSPVWGIDTGNRGRTW